MSSGEASNACCIERDLRRKRGRLSQSGKKRSREEAFAPVLFPERRFFFSRLTRLNVRPSLEEGAAPIGAHAGGVAAVAVHDALGFARGAGGVADLPPARRERLAGFPSSKTRIKGLVFPVSQIFGCNISRSVSEEPREARVPSSSRDRVLVRQRLANSYLNSKRNMFLESMSCRWTPSSDDERPRVAERPRRHEAASPRRRESKARVSRLPPSRATRESSTVDDSID